MWLAVHFLQLPLQSSILIFQFLSFCPPAVPYPTHCTLVSDGTLSLQALCASISDRASAKASGRGEGCPCAAVDEFTSANEDEDSAFLALQPFMPPSLFLLPDVSNSPTEKTIIKIWLPQAATLGMLYSTAWQYISKLRLKLLQI